MGPSLRLRFLARLADVVLGRPVAVLAGGSLLAALAAVAAVARLEVRSDLIDLLDPGRPSVREMQRLSEMGGGSGLLIVALEGGDERALKSAADDLTPRIRALPEVRSAVHRQDLSFLRRNAALFIETADLEEVRARMRRKIREIRRKENPFHVDLGAKPRPEPTFDDIVAKYASVGRKRLADDHLISPDGRMHLIIVKPEGPATDVARTRRLGARLDALFAERGLGRREAASHADAGAITYGYTGGYQINLEDLEAIRSSLLPTSVVAFGVILLLLGLFLRRLAAIALVEVASVVGLALTFGFAAVAVGRLNIITATIAGIVQGLGIDYGIHFFFRLREEHGRARGDFAAALRATFIAAGAACVPMALTTSAAFLALTVSRFRAFSEFGAIASAGIILLALATYAIIPAALLVLARRWPRFPELVLPRAGDSRSPDPGPVPEGGGKRFGAPGLVLAGAALATLALAPFAARTSFEHDWRRLLTPGQPSVVLDEEVSRRFEISSDAVAFYAADLDDYRALHERLEGRRPASGASVLSLFTFVPPRERQEANARLLALMREDLKGVDRDDLAPEDRALLDEYLALLDARPFGVEDLPDEIVAQFRAAPEARDRHPGWLAFAPSGLDLWDARNMRRYAEETAVLRSDDGREWRGASLAIIFDEVSEAVVDDTALCTAVAGSAVLGIALLVFGGLRLALAATAPLALGIAWMLGIASAIDLRINFLNVATLPLIFGYGIDAGVQICHRFRESGSVATAVLATGRAVAASMLATAAGFAALLVAPHPGLRSVGALASLGVACGLAVSLTVVPAVLGLIGRPRRD